LCRGESNRKEDNMLMGNEYEKYIIYMYKMCVKHIKIYQSTRKTFRVPQDGTIGISSCKHAFPFKKKEE
jgi:hypothetical protein